MNIVSTSLAVAMAGILGLSTPAAAGSTFEKFGDAMQIVLPAVAGVCAVRQRDLAPYAGRLVGSVAVVQGLKYGLGNASINQRPNGNSHGFPSGHTAAAFYGSSYLAHNCLETPGQKAIAYGFAVAVGASRLDANQHNVGQVVAGALIGYFFDTLSVSVTDNGIKLGMRYRF